MCTTMTFSTRSCSPVMFWGKTKKRRNSTRVSRRSRCQELTPFIQIWHERSTRGWAELELDSWRYQNDRKGQEKKKPSRDPSLSFSRLFSRPVLLFLNLFDYVEVFSLPQTPMAKEMCQHDPKEIGLRNEAHIFLTRTKDRKKHLKFHVWRDLDRNFHSVRIVSFFLY